MPGHQLFSGMQHWAKSQFAGFVLGILWTQSDKVAKLWDMQIQEISSEKWKALKPRNFMAWQRVRNGCIGNSPERRRED